MARAVRTTSRRHRLAWLAASATLLASLAATSAPLAYAGVGPVTTDPNANVTISHEAAIISVKGGTQRIDMRLTLSAPGTGAGLIIPTPSPAEIQIGTARDFGLIAQEINPEIDTARDWWTPNWALLPSTELTLMPGSIPERTDINVIDLNKLGAVTLRADNTDGINAWMEVNGFHARPAVTAQLAVYAEQGWSLTLIKLSQDSTLSGNVRTISLTFPLPATGPVYPLALTQASRAPERVDLFVFGQHRSHVTFADGHYITAVDGSTPIWAGPVKETSLQTTYGPYLTAFSLYFDQPTKQILGDLAFPQARTDAPVGLHVTQVQYMNLLGFPMAWWGCVAVLAVFAAFVRMLVRQRTRRVKARALAAEEAAAVG